MQESMEFLSRAFIIALALILLILVTQFNSVVRPFIIIASVVLTMYFPCVATFTVLIKELGIKDMIKSAFIMIISTLIVGFILNLVI